MPQVDLKTLGALPATAAQVLAILVWSGRKRIPIAELMRLMECSRPAIQDALTALRAHGLVEGGAHERKGATLTSDLVAQERAA